LRRQTTTAGEAIVGSSRNPRLDPGDLPLRYTAGFEERGRRRVATIFLDRQRAIIKTRSAIGAPLTVCLPVSAFEGVAVRMTPLGDNGDIEVVIELRHRDPALCLPLVVADDPAEVADAWRTWGEALGLPLLLVHPDGSAATVENATAPRPSYPRRRHSFFADRRPRFLTRRKRGRTVDFARLTAREIIARD